MLNILFHSDFFFFGWHNVNVLKLKKYTKVQKIGIYIYGHKSILKSARVCALFYSNITLVLFLTILLFDVASKNQSIFCPLLHIHHRHTILNSFPKFQLLLVIMRQGQAFTYCYANNSHVLCS